MPTTIEEGALTLEFSDEWQVVKWDDTAAYREGIQRLEGSKAVDVLAFSRARRVLLMIELKDFRGHRIKNKPRIRYGALFDEVGHKVRDTVAGVQGVARTGGDAEIAAMATRLAARADLLVILWLEEDRGARVLPRARQGRHKGRLSAMTQELKRRVRWLTPRALVWSRGEASAEDYGICVHARSP